jgi:hypothetical protein
LWKLLLSSIAPENGVKPDPKLLLSCMAIGVFLARVRCRCVPPTSRQAPEPGAMHVIVVAKAGRVPAAGQCR